MKSKIISMRVFLVLVGFLVVFSQALIKPVEISAASASLVGDVNLNGTVDIGDAMFIAQYTAGNRQLSSTALNNADVDGDGKINDIDAKLIAQWLAKKFDNLPRTSSYRLNAPNPNLLFGDANLDGKIDTFDALSASQAVVGEKELAGPALSNTDVDGDGKITDIDAKLIGQYDAKLISKFPRQEAPAALLVGDANLNGEIDIGDAMFISQYAAGNRQLIGAALSNADVNGDGKVTEEDANQISQYLAGKITKFTRHDSYTVKPFSYLANLLPDPKIFADQNTSFKAPTLAPGMTNTRIGSFILAVSSTENVNVNTVTIKTNITAYNLENLKLLAGGAQVGTTRAALSSNDVVVFNGLSAITIPAGGQKIIDVYADIKTKADTGLYGPVATLAGCGGVGQTSANSGSCLPTNIAGQAVSVYPPAVKKPDLIIKDIYIENNLVKVKYCNDGDNPIDVNIFGIETFYIKISANGKSHTGTSNNSNYIFSVPAAGQCANSDGLSINYFNLIAGTSYQTTAVIDHLGQVDEANESNNTFKKTITVSNNNSAKPDFAFREGSFKFYVSDGKQSGWPVAGLPLVYVEVEDKNKVYNKDKYDGWTMIVKSGDKSNVYAQDTISDYVRSYTINLIGVGINVDGKEHYLAFTIDGNNRVSESNESNNTLEKTIIVADVAANNNKYPGFYIEPSKKVYQADEILAVTLRRADGQTTPYAVNFWAQKQLSRGNSENYQLQSNVSVGRSYVLTSDIDKTTVFIKGGNGDYLIATCPVSGCVTGASNSALIKIQGFPKISPSITVLSPNRGESWMLGSRQTIRWKSTGNISQVAISLVPVDSGIGTRLLATATNSGSYSWALPNCYLGHECSSNFQIPAGNYKIQILDSNSGISDQSNVSFSIVAADSSTTNETKDTQITDITDNAKLLKDDKFSQILAELQQLRDLVKEQQTQIKYLNSLVKNVSDISSQAMSAINNFITYGVDANTKKLGAGERAAVINSYKSAFDKLPQTEAELADAIKIANGRFPSVTSDTAEQTAKDQFVKIYKRNPDLNNPKDNAAIKVMAYGLRQKAENRNLNSERAGIKIFANIFGHAPTTTEDWNTMQAITYSGASR